ncbi:MAG: hypothetical protein HUJ98_09965, partial [Bacteroidaceae bacterium]|nr:hypothetical protein [Bacteroidaceae bacterium]
MTEYLKLIIVWIGLVATNLPTVCAQELQFDQVKKARKSLRMDKPNEVQAILSQLYKPKPSKKNDAPLVAEGTEFDDSYLEGKKAKQQDSTEYHFINGLLKLHQFEKENAKLYLNQKPDTIAYFTRLYEMMDSFEKCYPSIH